MAQHGKPEELLTLQELALSTAYEIAAILAVLEQKGILTLAEVMEQPVRLMKEARKPQWISDSIGRLTAL